MMEYLAHSGKDGTRPQTYEEHIKGVCGRAAGYAEEAAAYGKEACGFTQAVRTSAVWHDLGKLEEENQRILRGDAQSPHLPVNHTDAGSAYLMRRGDHYSAMLVYSHHIGLPDILSETIREEAAFRDGHRTIRKNTEENLPSLIKKHEEATGKEKENRDSMYPGDVPVYSRLMLSCLADADHEDTAVFYGQAPLKEDIPKLRAKERLKALDRYVSGLSSDTDRSRLRSRMYTECRNSEIRSDFAVCTSPVGTGKTTAVMANILRQADIRSLRRIFVVLPYTNIISQSVEVYRKALVLPGEDPEEVVAAVHYRAEFGREEVRHLSVMWRAPVIVTTAVAFFETLASNSPSGLRKLHELPGSAVFVDEFHGAMPLKLIPTAWHWMNVLSKEWNCYWVLASGSMINFWELSRLKELGMEQPVMQSLTGGQMKNALLEYEAERVRFMWRRDSLSRHGFVRWIQDFPGPRLVIMNTVQSAAVVAKTLRKIYGEGSVEHLSTALTPENAEKEIEKVKARLADPCDNDWTLVATSCVEAGVDMSFATGFREVSSLTSLLEAAGRVNRSGEYENAQIWSFRMEDDPALRKNPAFAVSERVLTEFFRNGRDVTPELGTESVAKEIMYDDSFIADAESILKAERKMAFETVSRLFRIIDNDTVTAVIDKELAEEIRHGGGDWKQLQKKSVSIRKSLAESTGAEQICDGLYIWNRAYSPFIGYMEGIIGGTD